MLLVGAVYFYCSQASSVIEVDLPPAQEYQDFVEEQPAEPSQPGTEEVLEKDKELVLAVDMQTEVLGEKIEEVLPSKQEEAIEEIKPMADSLNLDVPFSSQAPTGNWNERFNDACEEASVLMVDYYYNNRSFLEPEDTETILEEMISWQEENWGEHSNLTIAKLAEYTITTFGYKVEVIADLTVDKIKEQLNQGRPVIVPADGKKLDNPFFTGDGPPYHMLVIKGYVDDKFITNDPGTKRGRNFIYTMANLMASIADWDTEKAQTVGPKVGLVLYSN